MSVKESDHRKESDHLYYLKNREEIRRKQREYQRRRRQNPEVRERESQRQKKYYDPQKYAVKYRESLYGMSNEEFENRKKEQGNRCAICKKFFDKTPHVDHDHLTGDNRGLLCGLCNRGLGFFSDNPDTLIAASEYIKTFRGEPCLTQAD